MKTKIQKSFKTKVFVNNTLVGEISSDGHIGTIRPVNQQASIESLYGREHLLFVHDKVTSLAEKFGVVVTDDNVILRLKPSEVKILTALTDQLKGNFCG